MSTILARKSLWREIQRKNITRLEDLIDFLKLDPSKREFLLKKPRFPLNLPLRLAEKIEKNTLDDPIFKQFVPIADEERIDPRFSLDPLSDQTFQRKKKLLHKYEGRVLLLCTSACAINCRFCFRQNFPYETKEAGFEEELEYIANDPSLSEVILSGGDPLSLENRALQELFLKLDKIKHVKRIRFHSRFPIGIPERIDEDFLEMLQGSEKQIFFVLHINHPQELDYDVVGALKQVHRLGIPILTHTVLLRGINDHEEVLSDLFTKLVDQGFLPYYLFQLDQVQGAAHFEVPESEGLYLMERVHERLSGYAVPRYVKEVPGAKGKTTI